MVCYLTWIVSQLNLGGKNSNNIINTTMYIVALVIYISYFLIGNMIIKV